jgi:alkylhydroperoxidase/carboxymuconolactone decarboxylase family protein YurZ
MPAFNSRSGIMHRPEDLISRFLSLYGYADAAVEQAAAADQAFFAVFLDMAAMGLAEGPLDRKMRDFVLIAANASVTQMSVNAVGHHIAAARASGASEAELREVLQITSVLGIHGYMLGAPVLLQEQRQLRGAAPDERAPLGERERAIRDEFRHNRRYWSDQLEDMLVASPDFFERYTAFSSHPWKTGVLAPKQRELLYVAIDAATTHLHEPGTRIHTRNALASGASREEVVQVLQIVSCMGFQSYLLAAPFLAA